MPQGRPIDQYPVIHILINIQWKTPPIKFLFIQSIIIIILCTIKVSRTAGFQQFRLPDRRPSHMRIPSVTKLQRNIIQQHSSQPILSPALSTSALCPWMFRDLLYDSIDKTNSHRHVRLLDHCFQKVDIACIGQCLPLRPSIHLDVKPSKYYSSCLLFLLFLLFPLIFRVICLVDFHLTSIFVLFFIVIIRKSSHCDGESTNVIILRCPV